MSMKKTLGGDRLGSGKKMQVELHGYERSTHDLSYIWRSTMSAGTLVPFMSEVALPGDTFDIDLDCDIKTHPTLGPLFGSFKVQLDVFQAPIRLYHAALHNNALGIGLNMASIKLPVIRLSARPIPEDTTDIDNCQINPSSLLAYLGIRGIGITDAGITSRYFNAVPILAYYEIYKNYYANKQEEIGAVIHTVDNPLVQSIDTLSVDDGSTTLPLSELPVENPVAIGNGMQFFINYTGTIPNPQQVYLKLADGSFHQLSTFINGDLIPMGAGAAGASYNQIYGPNFVLGWRYQSAQDVSATTPTVNTFPLSNIDDMRRAILKIANDLSAFDIEDPNLNPYEWLPGADDTTLRMFALNSQEGLAVKTYQSDLFNNWLSTEWIDGSSGINAITAIDTSGGSFTIDTLNLSKKVYNMLNRIAVSGGTYDDWLDAVWAHDRYTRAESPIYCGGLSKELVFQEVVSNAQSNEQSLGTLAGKGILSKKHKGGKIYIRVDEPSYLMGIISLTPRVDYSQGNKWDVHLRSLDDLHKPALDEIGFQELITEQMAWWDTEWDAGEVTWVQKSAGKQPAWINYMTNYNRTYGNFAIPDNEMFMTLNRRYERDGGTIGDLTTYIDPAKFNFIFAETSLDAQNFWAQIAVDITARRKMSAKVMPNL